jgi:hypothetical protein
VSVSFLPEDSTSFIGNYYAVKTGGYPTKKHAYNIKLRPSDSSLIYKLFSHACTYSSPNMIVNHVLIYRKQTSNYIDKSVYIDIDKEQVIAKEKPINKNWTYCIVNEPYYGR